MRRVHQADNGVIHMRVEGLFDDEFRLVGQIAKIGDGYIRLPVEFRIVRDKDKDQTVLLDARIAANLEPARLIGLLIQNAWHVAADTVGAEPPAMIRALHRWFAVRIDLLAGTERHQPVRADIAQRKDLTLLRATDDNRLVQHDDMFQAAGFQRLRRAPQIPAIGQPALGRDARLGLGCLVDERLRIGHILPSIPANRLQKACDPPH